MTCICSLLPDETDPLQHVIACPLSLWNQGKKKKMSQPKKTFQEVQDIIDGIRFRDREFKLMIKGDGFLLQMSYYEPDVTKLGSPPVKQSTRKWYISSYSTDSEVVETCFAMVCRSQLHVAGEHFTFHGRQVYSPHFNILKRMELCDLEVFDGRISPNETT
jgi:hypothetical protein